MIAKGYSNVNSDGKAVYCSNLTLARMILEERNGNPNLQNVDGNTALHLACARRDVAAIEALMRSVAADPQIKNNEGRCALDMLELDHAAASEVLRKTVGNPFLLDSTLHARSKEVAHSAFCSRELL